MSYALSEMLGNSSTREDKDHAVVVADACVVHDDRRRRLLRHDRDVLKELVNCDLVRSVADDINLNAALLCGY
eukprot:scaffold12631_cov133-Skeletonema_marinoi.AAC.10